MLRSVTYLLGGSVDSCITADGDAVVAAMAAASEGVVCMTVTIA